MMYGHTSRSVNSPCYFQWYRKHNNQAPPNWGVFFVDSSGASRMDEVGQLLKRLRRQFTIVPVTNNYKPAVQLMMASALGCPVDIGYFRESVHLGTKADFINGVVGRLGRGVSYLYMDDNLPPAEHLDGSVSTVDCREGRWLGHWAVHYDHFKAKWPILSKH